MRLAIIGGLTSLLCLILDAARAGHDGAPPHFISGGFSRGVGPDGNTVVFSAPDGLIVVDTGRHPGHAQAILDYAAATGRPISKIINTHWHLDHSTGNQDIKAAYPSAKLYATRAVEGALEGFLKDGAKQIEQMLATQTLTAAQRAELERGLKTVKDRVGLLPDVVVDKPMGLEIDGRVLELQVTDHAVTESDIWIWDPATKTVVAGDLVTLPAPFFDTACPAGWSNALLEVSRKPFETLIPGHGPPMTRADFARYQKAFAGLLACADDHKATDCPERWIADAGPLLVESEKKMARQFVQHYVDNVIRSAKKRHAFCRR